MSNDVISRYLQVQLICDVLSSDIVEPVIDDLQKDLNAANEIPETLADDLLADDIVQEAIMEEEQNRKYAEQISEKVNKAWYGAFKRGLVSVV